jgi:hypothetical protein
MAVYYIGTSGSDSADGLTWANRWLTYAHAGAVMVAGDTLLTAAITATTLKDLRQRLGGVGFCGDMLTGTADTNATTTIIVDAAIGNFPNDTFNFCQVAIVSGSLWGQRRWISDFVTTTGTITVDAAFASAISAGIAYEIHRMFSADDKDAALNQAIRDGGKYWWRVVQDTSLTLASNTYSYSLATLAVPVNRNIGLIDVEYLADDVYTIYERVNPDTWHIRDNNGTLYLEFDDDALPDEDATLRLTYKARPAVLSTDSSTLDPDLDEFATFICARAAGYLFQKQSDMGGESTRDHWQQRANQMQQLAMSFLVNERQGQPNARKTVSMW